MRYFVPDIRLSFEVPAKGNCIERIGGLPWGLPAHHWPTCTECGRHQSLLAQFTHHNDRLNLGRDGRVLFIFQCNHDPGMCDTWLGQSGANACFVLEPEQLLDVQSCIPDSHPSVEREALIVGWLEREDGIPESLRASFFNDSEYLKLPEATLEAVPQVTQLGSVPAWIQSADEAPKDGWRFAGQLDSYYSFYSAPSVPDDSIRLDPQKQCGRSHFCQGANFGDCGIGYFFLRSTGDGVPEGHFFWQCG